MFIYPQGACPIRPGKHVRELRIGDTIHWRYGDTDVVVGLAPDQTADAITCQLRDPATGSVTEREMPADRLVAVG